MKSFSIQSREILAWIVFICAIILFSCTIAFAQDKKTSNTVRIKIEKEENGKKTKIDTTVTKENLPQLKEYLKDSGIDFDDDNDAFTFENNIRNGKGNFRIHIDREKMKADMEKMHEDLAKMKEEMK